MYVYAFCSVLVVFLVNFLSPKNSHCIVHSAESASKEKKLLFVCLYYLIWGEAANVRFLPECLCYIFHHVSSWIKFILLLYIHGFSR